jgi:hypothetical protein
MPGTTMLRRAADSLRSGRAMLAARRFATLGAATLRRNQERRLGRDDPWARSGTALPCCRAVARRVGDDEASAGAQDPAPLAKERAPVVEVVRSGERADAVEARRCERQATSEPRARVCAGTIAAANAQAG